MKHYTYSAIVNSDLSVSLEERPWEGSYPVYKEIRTIAKAGPFDSQEYAQMVAHELEKTATGKKTAVKRQTVFADMFLDDEINREHAESLDHLLTY